MRVALDARSVFPGMGGIGRATAALARALPEALGHDELVVILGARRFDEPLVQAPNAREVHVDAAMIDAAFDQVFLPTLLEELEADVYHGTCFSIPIAADVARVATVHDVVFRRRPDLVEDGLRRFLDRWTGVSCDLAEAVVTVSEFSRREIDELYQRPAARIDVVSNAVDARWFDVPRTKAEPPFILYVGSIEPKKNVAALVDGFHALLKQDPSLPHHLVLAGSGAQELPNSERVHVVGHVPDAELARLYGAASAFAYLSEYEGFGLPPLEAMAAGVPTIVSDRSSLPEVTGGGALVVDPKDPHSVARGLGLVLKNPSVEADLARRGRAAAHRFSWRESAKKLVAIYRRVHKATSLPREAGEGRGGGK
jgi:glycosyltransferase involved in cell wall biosynthesis